MRSGNEEISDRAEAAPRGFQRESFLGVEMADDERIMMQNPNTGRDDCRIRVAIYEPTRDAILAAIDDEGELANSELIGEVTLRTPSELWEDNSVMWFTTTVKLHLEANGWITKTGSPQILSLTDAGHAELDQAPESQFLIALGLL